MITRIVLLTMLLLAWLPSAWAMEHYTSVLQDTKGNAIGHATVHVYAVGTTTHVAIYSDNGTTLKANPFSSNGTDGTYDFYAANGVYDLVFSKAGVTFYPARTARISLFDVNDGGGGGGGGSLTIGSSTVVGGIASSLLYVSPGSVLQQVSLNGLIIGNGAATPTAFPGVTCTNQFLRVFGSTGAGTCTTVSSAYVDTSIWTGTATTGILKATSQGVLATATAGTDYTSPTSTETPTNKTINCAGAGNSCSNISLSSDVIGILQGANGGTANGFMDFTGPATSLKTYTLPNATTTILTEDALVTLAQGGTSNATWTPTTCVRVNAGGTALESTGSDCAVGGTGAPTDATYWTGAAHGDLSAEINLGALGTGLVINTGGTPSIYAGVTCTNQVLRLLSASGAGTCVTVGASYVDTTIWTGTVSNGILKATSQGVLAQAITGVDYADPSTANVWTDGIKQTFNPNGTSAGINVGQQAGDPSVLVNADIWYNSSTGKFRCRQGGTTFDCIITSAVSSVDATGGTETTTGVAITATGTIRGSELVNNQTGTTYTVVTGDRGKMVTLSNASAIAVTLPVAGGTFPAGWYTDVSNRGAGTVTITPTTSTIDGDVSVELITNSGVRIASDGTNYFTLRGNAPYNNVDTLDTVFDRGKSIDGANNFTNAVRVEDGSNAGTAWYTHATYGPQVNCYAAGVENDCNYSRWLLTGKAFNFLANDRTTAIGTLTAGAASGAWTNMTLDTEGTGNTLTTTSKISLKFVGCNGTTGTLLWDTNATLAPTPTCLAGVTNTTLIQGYADFPDGDGEYQFQEKFRLPADWTGNIDLQLYWKAAAITNNVVWQAQTLCRADAEIEDAAWNTAQQFAADTAKGTTLQLNTVTLSALTTTGCSAGEMFYLKIFRQRTNASDTITGVVSLSHGELTLRRAQ